MIINQVSAGGLNVNGALISRPVGQGQSVKAGDFVVYDRVTAESAGIGRYITDGCLMSENTALFFGQIIRNGKNDVGVVAAKIEDNATEYGATLSHTLPGGGYNFRAASLNSTTALAVYRGVRNSLDDSYYTLHAQAFTVQGTSVSLGPKFTIVAETLTRIESDALAIARIDDERALIAYRMGSSTKAVVVKCSGGTLTASMSTALSANFVSMFSMILFSENRVLIHGKNASSGVALATSYAQVITVNNMSITVGTVTAVDSAKTGGGDINPMALLSSGDTSRVFIAKKQADAPHFYYGIFTISGTSVTLWVGEGSVSSLYNHTGISGNTPGLISLGDGRVEIFWHNSDDYTSSVSVGAVFSRILTTSGNSVIEDPYEKLAGALSSDGRSTYLASLYAFNLGDGNRAYWRWGAYGTHIRKRHKAFMYSLGGGAMGVAKKGGADGQMIDVYTPN